MSDSVGTDKPLLVLNASAGSGKTFSLVRNFLRLLLTESDERTELGQIVAMTFTNKAALEMKTRIMRDLYQLASGKPEDRKSLLDMAAYLEMDVEKVQQNASNVLRKLLHQYENFNVLTIDKFNLKLIRSFSRDLNLPEKFDIVLNESQLLDRAIDELLDSVDAKDQGKMYRLTMNFSKKTLHEQSDWNVKRKLVEKADTLTKEVAFPIIQALIDTEITAESVEQWKLELAKIESQFNTGIERLKNAFEAAAIGPDEFSGKSVTFKRFSRLTVTDGFKADDTFFDVTPSFLKNIESTAEKSGFFGIQSELESLLSVWKTHKNRWNQLTGYLHQLPILRLLRELAISMNSIRDREATILISEFNKLISKLVKNEEAPFIYERLGSRYQHFFLDEFQDTSHLQWMNLVPMIHESLGHNRFNFIVGDPKQSIYRFKNGVAEQFVCLPRIYNPDQDGGIELKSRYFEMQGRVDFLPNNWRSAEEIVRFNNLFFKRFTENLEINGKQFYNGLEQVPKGKPAGYVHIEYLLTANTNDSSDDEEDDSIGSENEERLLRYVSECIADGYQPGDICILARKKDECNLFANALKRKGYQVVSADSLLTHSDQGVRLLMLFLEWRSNPQHVQRAQLFASEYFHFVSPDIATQRYSRCFVPNEEGTRSYFSIGQFLIESGLSTSILSAPYSSIYGLLENVIFRLGLDELKNGYIHQLLDIAYQFDAAMGPTLEGFIDHYRKEAYKTNVMIPENSGAITVMTAHKSKGLEFPVVILPKLNFYSPRKNTLLVKTSDFVIETGVSKKAQEIDYLEPLVTAEMNAIYMDALNLMYVAFTRPVDRLYAFGITPKKSNDFTKRMEEVLKDVSGAAPDEKARIFMEWGTKPERTEHHKESDFEAFYPTPLEDRLWFPEISLRSKSTTEYEELSEQIRLGKQFHSVMEQSDSLEKAILLIEEGIKTGTVALSFKEAILGMVSSFYQNEAVKELLQSGKHLNERTLLVDEHTRLRPDKLIVKDTKAIVLDFKTGSALPKHEAQIRQYAEVLQKIGYVEVEAYLYYSTSSELKQVASDK